MCRNVIVIVSSFRPLSFRILPTLDYFPALIVNGTNTAAWKYVRQFSPDPATGNSDFGRNYPLHDVTSADINCNRNAAAAGPKTSIATVVAGSEVGFTVAGLTGSSGAITHDGPGQAYLSKAPNNDIEKYDGKGDWFKIAYIGPKSDTAWKLTDQSSIKFNIPKATPNGKYLLRVDQFYPSTKTGDAGFFVSCAQIEVVGSSGTSEPTTFGKFPGAYSANDPG